MLWIRIDGLFLLTMLSILIPVYNYDVRALVEDLNHQAHEAQVPYEIIVVDDNSDDNFKRKNGNFETLKRVRFESLKRNIGRSQIRNYLVKKATYDWLLFLDCDSAFPNSNFIKNYIAALEKGQVIVGGRIYNPAPPEDLEYYFHWKYGTRREVKMASERAINPYLGFMTNNFVIKKDVFQVIEFDPTLKQYGHEDTLFGQQLKAQKISIAHIDNPAIHTGLEQTNVFIQKSKLAIDNLLKINASGKEIKTRIMDAYEKAKPWLRFLNKFFPNLMEHTIRRNLNSSRPSLKLFDLYRLLYLANEIDKK